jgi:hypothetical protein|tara:strand:- start:65 stop:553 length:489 start_codon:yes stop_codon:yes gene_type:complete
MADLVSSNELFYTPYEPKLKNRFIMDIDGIPAYTIKTAQRPQITFEEVTLEHMNITRYVKGKGRWQQLQITLYDPIVPSAASAVIEWIRLHHESATGRDGYSDFYKKNINFQVLGPVGDIIEKWTLNGAFIADASFGDMDFASSDPIEITLTLRYDYAILEF